MPELRHKFHDELNALEGDVQRTGALAQPLIEKALQALASGDPVTCDAVIRGDDEVDKLYLAVERHILNLFARQTRSHPTCGCSPCCCTSTCTLSASPTRR